MPETLRSVDLSIEEAAELFHVTAATIRRRVRDGELRTVEQVGPGPARARLSPAETWVRVEDASALLGVAPATVRSNVTRGRLAGRREKGGRWRIQLRSVLEDPRCEPGVLELFGGAAPAKSESSTTQIHTRPHSLHKTVFVRLSPEEAEVLERGRDRHGTQRAAVVAGLHAIDVDELDVDAGELRAERDLFEEQVQRLRTAHRGLRDRAEGHLVDELYCHVCERWVAVDDCAAVELEDGRLEIFHEKHGHRSGARFRMNTGLARRAKFELAPVQ